MHGMSEPRPASTSPESAFSAATPYRDVTCGDLRAGDVGREVLLAGWVHRRRDHGHLIFLDVRDRYGITQVVVNESETPDAAAVAARVRNEFVLQIRGSVARRLAGSENARLATGEIEVRAQSVEILSEAETPPFYINEPDAPVDESLRLKYRYLDIRRRPMLERLMLRSELVHAIREAHYRAGFVEVETPILLKSTPEGARDFIVPSRLQPGSVYALPQSPQQLKQLLMVAGMDRYFQIARCFRDEDLRGDRQLEFTQLDLEMSFVTEQRVMDFVEAMIVEVSGKVVPDRPIQELPFPRIDYHEALERFGSDKPDLRFGMELVDLAPALGEGNTGFRVFDEAIAAGGRVKAVAAPGMADSSRSQIEEIAEFARQRGAKGLAHISVAADGTAHSPIAKFLGEERIRSVVSATGAGPNDLILIVADASHEIVAECSAASARSWACASGSPTRTSWRTAGSSISRCTSGTSRRSAGMPPTIPSAACSRRTRACSSRFRAIRTSPPARIRQVGRGRCSTTSRSTAGSSAAGRCGSTGASSSSAASRSRATRSRRCTSCSAGSWRPSTTGRRRTAASPWASTAGRPSSRSRRTFGRSWPSRRPNPGQI